MKYSTVFFDMDGTLVETGPAIFASTRATLNELGLSCPPDEKLNALIGPPLRMGFLEILGMPEAIVDKAVALYRQKAQELGVRLARPYEGIPALLAALKERGVCMGVVTSKVHTTALEQLEAFGLAPYVSYVRGAFADGRGEKTDLLRIAVSETAVQAGSAVMVGDRFFDLNAARACSIDSIGVLYGYGEAEEIASCAPTHTVSSVSELTTLLLS